MSIPCIFIFTRVDTTPNIIFALLTTNEVNGNKSVILFVKIVIGNCIYLCMKSNYSPFIALLKPPPGLNNSKIQNKV